MMRTVNVLLYAFVCCSVSAQTGRLNLTEGQVCGTQGSLESKCKYVYDCPKALQDFKATGKKPVVCNFWEKHPIICCEPDGNPPPGTKSKQMCKKYAASVYESIPDKLNKDEVYLVDTCAPDVASLIVGSGGGNTTPTEYPHMALIGHGSADSKSWLCGGSLISERFVLSAAHCTNTTKGPAKWVLLGEYNKKSKHDDVNGLSKPTLYNIVERFNHPGYQEPSLYHDIALYRLDRDVEFNMFIRPTCLQTEYAVSKPYAIVTGWGRLEYAGKESDVLQKVNVTFQSLEKCKEMYGVSAKKLQIGILDANMFCAGDNERDSCQGDSGGPLQLKLEDPYCMYTQIGVVSFGDACALKSGVYTRVSYYIPWIERTVWP